MPKDKKHLRAALYAIGSVCVIWVPILILCPPHWSWTPPQFEYEYEYEYEYEQMVMGIYMTLGVFLILAARNPTANRSLIWSTIWSSIVHGTIVPVQALVDPAERDNLLGDTPALLLVAAASRYLMAKSTGKA